MPQKDLVIVIGAKTDGLVRGLNRSEDKVRAFGAALAVAGAGIAVAVNEFRKYEKALVGVGKTTGLTGQALKQYGKDIKDLSAQTGQATNDLLAISQAAGQLGVTGAARLKLFTETIAKLGTASDLAGEEAATTLTRILNVTGEGVGKIDKFASVIVRLGNNFAASESEIARMAQEVSRATAVFGASSAQSAALGTALRSVGVQAELGGSVVGKAFRMIDESIRTGGNQMKALEIVTGMTGAQLKKTFEQDATAVFQKFVEGLGNVKMQGGSVAAVLEDFGLKGDEINKVLPVLAERSDLLGDAMAHASDEVGRGTALNEEFAAQADIVDQKLNILSNSVQNLSSTFGEQMAPAVSFAAGAMAEDIDDVSESIEALGTIFRGLATIIAEAMNYAMGKMDEFNAANFRLQASAIENFQKLANALPFVETSFSGSIDAINAKAAEYEESAKERLDRAAEFFQANEKNKTDALAEGIEQRNTKEDENYQERQELDEERRAAELEIDQERREEDLEIEDERHQQDIEREIAQLAERAKIKKEQDDKTQDEWEKAQKKLEVAKEKRVRAEQRLDQILVDSSFDALSQIVGDNKAAQTALIIARKGVAFVQALINAKQGATLALSHLPHPYGELVAAERIAYGKSAAAAIAATAVPEIAGTFAARDGGSARRAAGG